jgi:transketolase
MAKDFKKYDHMRDAFVDAVSDMAKKDDRIVMLDADLSSCINSGCFQEAYPDRFFNVGISEADLVGISAGLSSTGLIPFAHTFACFASRRAFDQFFLSANYAQQNVKLVGSDPGITSQMNGGTHMPFEDFGLMKMIPGLVVFEPSDSVSCYKLTEKAAEHKGSTYMRLRRKGTTVLYSDDQEFELGKGIVLKDGTDITIIATGMVMVTASLEAAEILGKEGISAAVIDMHTIKPLDEELVMKYAEKTGAIVTCEDAQRFNGLGSSVSDYLSENRPTLVRRVGVDDEFGEVGKLDYLQKRFKMTAEDVARNVRETLALKNK